MKTTMRRWHVLVAVLFASACAWIVWTTDRERQGNGHLRVTVELISFHQATHQLFFAGPEGFNGRDVVRAESQGIGSIEYLHFDVPGALQRMTHMRLDLGEHPSDNKVRAIVLQGPYRSIRWTGEALRDRFNILHHLQVRLDEKGDLCLHSLAEDPFLSSSFEVTSEIRSVMTDEPPRIRPFVHAFMVGSVVLVVLLLFLHWWPWMRSRWPLLRATTSPHGIALLGVDALVFIVVLGLGLRAHTEPRIFQLRVNAVVPRSDKFQVYFAEQPGLFDGSSSTSVAVQGSADPQWITFQLSADPMPRFIRIDPGTGLDSVVIRDVELALGNASFEIPLGELATNAGSQNNMEYFGLSPSGLVVRPNGNDPYFTLDHDLSGRVAALRNADRSLWSVLLAAMLVVFLTHSGLSRSARFRSVFESASGRDVSLATIFLVFLTLPLASLFHPGLEPTFPFSEKRRLAPPAVLQLNGIGVFPSNFEAWYRDHFPFRKALYRWNSWLHIRVLRTSPLPELVVLGKHGWLFQYDRSVDSNYRGIRLFTFDELERIRATYEKRQRWLAGQGIDYYLMIPPLSGNIHAEHMPDHLHRISDTTWLGQVKEHFDRYSTVPLVDVRAELLEGKQTRPIYFTTDIHWNPYGAYLGYRKLVERIRKDHPELEPPWPITDVRFDVETNSMADLAQLLGSQDMLTREEPIATLLRNDPAKYSHPSPLPPHLVVSEPPQVYTPADTTKPRLLMFHDSFGVSLRPLISQHFSSSTFVWSAAFYPEAVTLHRPGIVVQEFMEMFVPEMVRDTLALP